MMVTLVARNATEATIAPVVGYGGVCIWRESGFSRLEDISIFNPLYTQNKFLNIVLSIRFAEIILQ
jgi:hypothetical protein